MVTPIASLNSWIQEIASLCSPERIHLVTGSPDEARMIEEELVSKKTFIPLNPEKRPHSFLARSSPDDVARVEDRTFICSVREEDAGPTNNWQDPKEMKKTLLELFRGCMRGRTLYVVPFCMGPIGSSHSRVAVQLTDSPYVVASMRLMTRVGEKALSFLKKDSFVKCLHSVGKPKEASEPDVSWPCNTKNLYISHFPETMEVWSFGSGYGGNALLNKKSFALRLASKMAKEEGWLAEHMMIVGVTNPEGHKKYFAGAFPSACGKTNLAMLMPTLKGWKVECVGDDIAWLHWGKDGRLFAINPEAGFFGVAPGTSMHSNPQAMRTIQRDTIFTNTAMTDDGDVWWEGMTEKPPEHVISWKGEDWTAASGTKAAHPNSRFTVSNAGCPVMDSEVENPEGVPISGIIFGGRRSDTIPLVRQALSFRHGVFLAASMSSETTAAATGELGRLRRDPFAMKPFCGYNMADYFAHWLAMEQIGEEPGRKLPEIFYVNWFQKDAKGKFLWPGFGENIRVIKWMFDVLEKKVETVKTAIGFLPKVGSIDTSGLDLAPDTEEQLFKIEPKLWREEAEQIAAHFEQFGSKLPKELKDETETLKSAFS